MANYSNQNSAAQYSLQLLRGQMVTDLISGQMSGDSNGISLNEFILGKPQKQKRTGKDIMNDALTGLIRSDARMLRQASKNMSEGKTIVKIAAEGVKSVQSKIGRMQEILGEIQTTPSQAKTLQTEYNQLVKDVSSVVSNTQYNGIKLLDGSVWNADERVNKSSDNDTGTITLQAGNSPTDLTLFNLESLKTGLQSLDLPNYSSAPGFSTGIAQAGSVLGAAQRMLSGMAQTYEARSGLYASEASYFERQAETLEEAAKRADPGDEDSMKNAILDILLRDQCNVFD